MQQIQLSLVVLPLQIFTAF